MKMKRELNDLEYFQWIFGQPYNIVMAVRFQGELKPIHLRNVLDKIQQRHPLLQVTTILDERGKPWFTSEGVGKIPINFVARQGDEHILRVVEQELATKFSMDTPQITSLPLMRVTLLAEEDSNAKKNEIIFCTQHTIADGMSMVFMFRDFMHFIDNPDDSILILDALVSDSDLFPPKIRKRMPKTMFRFNLSLYILKFRHWLKFGKTKKASIINQGDYLAGISESKSQKKNLNLYSWTLTPAETGKFIKRCKQEKVSVHAALSSIFLPSFSTINSPVNMRPRFARPVGESFGFLSSSILISMKYNSKIGFWKNARKFHNKLLYHLRDRKIFSIYKIFSKVVPRAKIQKMGSIYRDLTGFNLPFTITNLGSLDNLGISLTMENLIVEEFFGGVSGIGIVLLVFTINQIMHFHLYYVEPETKESVVHNWVKNAMDLLRISILNIPEN